MKLNEVVRLSIGGKTKPELNSFLDELDDNTSPNPFDNKIRIWQDSIGFEVSKFNGKIHLSSIINFSKKGTGEASRGLKWFCELADKHQVEIDLTVSPIKAGAEGKNLTKAQLMTWYSKNGFKKESGDEMIRKPSAK